MRLKADQRVDLVMVKVNEWRPGCSDNGLVFYEGADTIPRDEAPEFVAKKVAEALLHHDAVHVVITPMSPLGAGFVVKKDAA